MHEVMDSERIREIAAEFGTALERRDRAALLKCFADDCEIELVGVKLHGHDGVNKWFRWTCEHMKEMRFDSTSSAVTGNMFFEEYTLDGTIHNGRKAHSKQSRVLEFENGLVKKFRVYLDRLQFAESVVNDFATRMVVKKFIDMSVKTMVK